MPNFHPPLSAFPLVLITLQVFFELLYARSKRAEILYFLKLNLALILLFAAAAFFSGYQASELADQSFQVPNEPIEAHHLSGRFLFFLSMPTCAIGVLSQMAKHSRANFRVVYLFLLGMLFLIVIRTGLLGGRLVFTHGAGVNVDLSRQKSSASSELAVEPPSKIEPNF